uniref:hypothetical protein n=1 Tax=Streptomyces sp. NRRL S-813 TaxID=1463919 RepID=UPI0004C23524
PFNPNPQAADLLGYLAWTLTAAAIAGLIIIGIKLALQLRRGLMGEGTAHFQAMAAVLGACILGVSAGPIVEFVVSPYLGR